MNKQRFLDILGNTLEDSLPAQKVSGHVAYYREYIEEQVRLGKREEDVLAMLGDPRLIARTIVETTPQTGNKEEYQNYFYEQKQKDEDLAAKKGKWHLSERARRNLQMVIWIVVLAAILWLVVSILTFLVPIVLPIVFVLIILSYFKRR